MHLPLTFINLLRKSAVDGVQSSAEALQFQDTIPYQQIKCYVIKHRTWKGIAWFDSIRLTSCLSVSVRSLQLSYVVLSIYIVSQRKNGFPLFEHNSYRNSHFLPPNGFLVALLSPLRHRQFTFSFTVGFYLMAFKLIRFYSRFFHSSVCVCFFRALHRDFHGFEFRNGFRLILFQLILIALLFFSLHVVCVHVTFSSIQRVSTNTLRNDKRKQKQSMMWQNGFSTFIRCDR